MSAFNQLGLRGLKDEAKPAVGYWTSTAVYSTDHLAAFEGKIYVSLQDSNVANAPTDPLWWSPATGTAGDMYKSVYDPSNKEADAFDSSNTYFDNTDTELASDNVQAALIEVFKTTSRVESGWIVPPILSVNADTTKFNISSGIGIHADYSSVSSPVFTLVRFAGATAVVSTYLNSTYASGIMIGASGEIHQESGLTTSTFYRQYIFVGDILHNNRTSINGVQNKPITIWDTSASLRDLALAIGVINTDGNVYTYNTTDLQIRKTVGTYFRIGINYAVDPLNPNHITNAAIAPISAFLYGYRNADGTWYYPSSTYSAITPALYDSGTGTPTAVSANNWTLQRIYNFPNSNQTIIHLGQKIYSSYSAAVAGLQDAFISDAQLRDAALRAVLIVRGGASNLSLATDAVFIMADRFGRTASSAAATEIPDHNALNGLQGGITGEYYHITAAEKTALENLATSLSAKADKTTVDTHIANTSNPHTVTKAQVGLGNVDDTSDANKPISTATQTALNAKADASTVSAHTTSTSNPHSVTQTQVGLGNVDNTSDANKPISTATQTALDLKANLAGAAFTGEVTVQTPALDDDTTKAANTAWVKDLVAQELANGGYVQFAN